MAVSLASLASIGVGLLDGGGNQTVGVETAARPLTANGRSAEPGPARTAPDRRPLVVDLSRLTDEPDSRSTSTSAPIESPDDESDETDGAAAEPAAIVNSTSAVASADLESTSVTIESRRSESSGTTVSPTTDAPTTATSTGSTTTKRTTTSERPTTSAPTPPGDGWEEHFNTLDSRRWRLEHSTYGDGNGERQCYQPDNVRVTGGRLVLTAKSETATCPNGSTRTVTSGMVRSQGLTFSPGQSIEFRVKLTPPDPYNQAGLWPAVWASGWAGSWPRGGELDFLEVMTAEDPKRAVFSLHYADRSGDHELQNKAVPLAGFFSDGWHTIRFDYGHNGRLTWFMDGTRVFSVDAADTVQGYPAPFDQTIHEIKINLAIGGRPGPLAANALGSTGATFEVDYVKVFAG